MFTNISQPSQPSQPAQPAQPSSSATNGVCSENSPYDKIYTDEPVRIKPSKYCKIDKDAGKIYFCKPSGVGKSHVCEYTAPYKKPTMMSSFFSKGGKSRKSNKRKNKGKTRKTSKKNKTKRSKKSKK